MCAGEAIITLLAYMETGVSLSLANSLLWRLRHCSCCLGTAGGPRCPTVFLHGFWGSELQSSSCCLLFDLSHLLSTDL